MIFYRQIVAALVYVKFFISSLFVKIFEAMQFLFHYVNFVQLLKKKLCFYDFIAQKLLRQVQLQIAPKIDPLQVGDASHLSRRLRNRNAGTATGSLAVAAKRAQSVESVLERIPQVIFQSFLFLFFIIFVRCW